MIVDQVQPTNPSLRLWVINSPRGFVERTEFPGCGVALKFRPDQGVEENPRLKEYEKIHGVKVSYAIC